ncbi:MAG: glycosyltransferase [Dehalococcoidia bacterium]
MVIQTATGTALPQRKISRKQLDDYREIVGKDEIEEIRTLALPLQGKRVLHINSSPSGGGVADILEALVPLLNDIGLSAEWRTIRGDASFFEVTKKLHNSLQGKSVAWTRAMWNTWLKFNHQSARELDPDYDIIVVHDPQPAAMLRYMNKRNGNGRAKWLWRCHIDLTDTPPELWRKFLPYVQLYGGVEFSMGEFVGRSLTGPEIFVAPPAIDPLDAKNVRLGRKAAAKILAPFGIDPERPIMAQVSRFDPWKDPLGVIDAYRLVKAEVKELQLVLIGPTAVDDPEGMLYFEHTARRAGDDPDIHLLTNFKGAGDLTVNAVQTLADVLVQKSIREGFGMSVAGSLWHGKPVVAGRAGGIVLQVIDGETGFLVDSMEECADKALALLQNPALSRKLGKKAKEHVRRNFLITRYIRDSLATYQRLLDGSPS